MFPFGLFRMKIFLFALQTLAEDQAKLEWNYQQKERKPVSAYGKVVPKVWAKQASFLQEYRTFFSLEMATINPS